MNKAFYIIVAILVAAFLAYWLLGNYRNQSDTGTVPTESTQEQGSSSQSTDSQSPSEPSSTEQAPEAAAETVVTYTDDGFSPDSIEITAGTKVVFINQSSRSMWVASDPHPIHSDDSAFDSRVGVGRGESYSYTFTRSGRWGYHNHLRTNDGGTVTVK